MNASRIISVAALVAFAALSGCNASFNKDATFLFTGSVTDSAGVPAVLGVDDEVYLCANVSYNELAQGRFVAARSRLVCEALVTNQTAEFSLMSLNELTVSKDSDTIEIKNMKVYARKEVVNQSSSHYLVMPAKISEIQIREDGATIKADVVVMDF